MVNKKAVSLMVSYVILISMAIGLSIGVYVWSKDYLNIFEPKIDCKEGTSLFLEDYDYDGGVLSLSLKNNGYFNIDGFMISASNDSNRAPIDLLNATGAWTEGFPLGHYYFRLSSEKITKIPFSSLIGEWKFDGNARDSVGENHGIINGSPQFVDGKVNMGLEFDGDHVEISDSSDFNDFNTAFSVSAWAKPTSWDPSHNTIVGQEAGFLLAIDSSGNLANWLWAGGSWTKDTSSNPAIPLDEWTHFALTYDGSTIRSYIDGTLQGPGMSKTGDMGTTSLVYIGKRDPGTYQPFHGTIDEVKIFNKALTEEQVKSLYNSAKVLKPSETKKDIEFLTEEPVKVIQIQPFIWDEKGYKVMCEQAVIKQDITQDIFYFDIYSLPGFVSWWKFDEEWGANAADSIGNNDGTLNNMNDDDWVIGKSGNALEFDGSNDYVSAGDINAVDGVTELTVSAWIKINNLDKDHDVFAKGVHAGNMPILFWRDDVVGSGSQAGNTNAISVLVYDGDTQAWTSSPDNSLNDLNWHHVLFTFTANVAGGLKIYVDNVNVNSASTVGVNSIQPTSNVVTIGSPTGGTTSNIMNGQIDEVMIFNTALSAQNISDIYDYYMN